MKLPNLPSKTKIRDAKILDLAIRENMSSYQIADYLIEHGHWLGNRNSVASGVRKMLYRRKDYLKIEKDFESFKQFQRVKRHIGEGKKCIDWEHLLDKILHSNQPIIKQETHLHVTNFKGFLSDAYRGNGKDRADILPDSSKNSVRLPL